MNTNQTTSQLVRMSGQFWKLGMEGNSIVLISTILGIRKSMSFDAFKSAIVSGRIQTMGGI